MSKGLLNIFIIAIACVALTVAPINSSILRLEIKSQNSGTNLVDKGHRAPIFALVPLLPTGSTLNKPTSLDFEISSGNLEANSEEILQSIQIVLNKDGSPIFTKTAKDLNATITADKKSTNGKAEDKKPAKENEGDEATSIENSMGKLRIPLKFSKLNLTSGNYTIDINFANSQNPINFNYNIIYVDGKSYAKAAVGFNSSYMVYQPEYNLELLLPVSYNGINEYMAAKSIKQLILKNAPESFKLSKKKLALYDADYILTDRKLNIDFKSKLIAEKSLSSTDNTLQIRGMVETALANNLIDEVSLTVDGIEDITILNTKLGSSKFKKPKTSNIYVGLVNKSNRLFIFPYSAKEAQVSTGVEASTKPDALISLLQTAKLPSLNGGGQMINPVPPNVKLIDYKVNGNSLTLNFSSSLLGAFGQDPDYIALMLDSIVNTMTESGKYDTVIFNVEGKPIESIGTTKIENSYKFMKSINPAY